MSSKNESRGSFGLAQSYAPTCARSEDKKPKESRELRASAKRDLNPLWMDQKPIDDPLGEPMTIDEVAYLLGCSVWTVRQRHLRLGLPSFRTVERGKFLFYRKQVVQWILENQKREEVNTRDPLEARQHLVVDQVD